jgi:hypothetical protein
MQFRSNHARLAVFRYRALRCAALGVVLAAPMLAVAQTSAPPPEGLRMDKIDQPTPINQPPCANVQLEKREEQAALRQEKFKGFAAANLERRKQIAEDSARMMKLAAELKDELTQAADGSSAPGLIRKLAEIEKLAHGVKEKMKLIAGGT